MAAKKKKKKKKMYFGSGHIQLREPFVCLVFPFHKNCYKPTTETLHKIKIKVVKKKKPV